MSMKIVALSGLLGLCTLSFAAHADDEADLTLAGEAVGEMVTVEAMLSAAIDGECRQYVPEKLRISRETMRLEIADLQEMLPQSSRKRLTEQFGPARVQSADAGVEEKRRGRSACAATQ